MPSPHSSNIKAFTRPHVEGHAHPIDETSDSESPRIVDPAVLAALNAVRGQRRPKGWHLILLIGATTALIGLGFAHWRARTKPPVYELGEVRRGDLRIVVTATGTLEAKKTVEIGAEVTGRITHVAVDYNDRVTKGQELATIDPEQLRASAGQSRAELAAARAAVLEARASVEETRLSAARAEVQHDRALISSQQFESARAAAARAKAALSSAEARAALSHAALELASTRLEKTQIVSPIDGIVLSKTVEPGQTVTAGFQTPILFKLAEDLSQMRLAVAVDEADVGRVREGLTATFAVDAYPGRQFVSRVVSVRNEPKTTQNVVTYQAVLDVDNTERLLRPGMTATARILSQTLESVVLVPSEAFRFSPPERVGMNLAQPPKESSDNQVFVLSDGKPKAIIVKIGLSDGNLTAITSDNLPPGSKVILDFIEAS